MSLLKKFNMPKILLEKCIGCGTCAALCPNTFEMTDDNKAKITNPAGDDPDSIQMAVDACPTQAIIME